MADEQSEWIRANTDRLVPEDERFVRGYDPFTAGLVLCQLNLARRLAEALFGPRSPGGRS